MFASWKKIVSLLSVAALLNASSTLAQAQEHQHSHAHEKPAQLTLNNGKKWIADDNLRQGMSLIRDALSAELPAIHSGQATAEQYRALAKKTNDQIAFIVKNCKMEQKMDAVLHLVLAAIIAGSDAMMAKDGNDARHGAEKIVKALDDYGTYFDHPGWHGASGAHPKAKK
jgi:Ni/Co efflux regulator RcnB